MTTVLAVGAHPDDAELLCGGTLILLARGGVDVHIACLTAGEGGVDGVSAEESGAIRLDEARRAAAIAGAAGFHCLGHRASFAANGPHARLPLLELMRGLAVDLLIAHGAGDYHADHIAAHAQAVESRLLARVAGVGEGPPLPRAPDLVFMDTVGGLGFDPHVWIDVSTVIETRREMLACHASQAFVGDVAETMARFRGMQRGGGTPYAEAFRHCGLWPNPDGGLRRLIGLLEPA